MFRRLFILPVLLPLVLYGDNRIDESLRLLTEADQFALLYNWPQAAPLYAQAESLFKRAGDRKNAVLARLGYLWANADNGVSPTISNEVAGYLQDRLLQSDPKLMLRTLVTKAVLDRNTNETAARESWEQILKLARAIDDKSWEARAKAEIGQILYMEGNVKAAGRMLREAIISQFLRLDFGAAIYYSSMVGNGFVEAGQPEAGLQYCNTALKTARFAKGTGFPFLAYQGKARALIALHRQMEAEIVLSQALKQARQERNNLALTELLIVAGTAAASSNPAMATHYLQEATEVSQEKGFHHVFAWSTFELAQVYRDGGNLDGAESQASKAIAVMRSLGDRYHLPQHLALLAELEVRRGNFRQADQLYGEATDVLNALLVHVPSRQLNSSLIATLSEAYVGYFKLAATELSNPNKAYEIIEEARGRSIADTLRGESESLSSSDEITLEAQKEINRIQIALMHEANPEGRQSLLDQLFLQEQLLSPIRRASSPPGSATTRPKPILLRTLQDSLADDEMILEYVLAEPKSYCVQITRSGAAVLTLPAGRKHVEGLVESYLSAIRSKQPEFAAGSELFSVLVQPAISQKSKTRLIIVPVGKLHLLPFDALTNQDGKYVLESHVVTYAPSATVLHLLRSHASNRAKVSFLGVGGVDYSRLGVSPASPNGRSAKENVAVDLFDIDGVILPNLPGTRQEVMSVAGIIKAPTQLLLQGNATEDAFKALSIADFGIIHLAVHGIANAAFPDRAALVLGRSSTSAEDGLLQVREIRDLPLHADLVTLSACETGNGRLLGEEGMASIESAFLLAGAKAVIASLWTADDTYTITLMKRLYQHLVDGDDKGAALRQAKIELLQQFGDQALPIRWACFTLAGDGSTPIFK